MDPTTTADDGDSDIKAGMVTGESQTLIEDEYSRWRPKYHLIAPTGWVNDPCAPGYDQVHGVYHVGFQWVPDSVEWNNTVSWGSAISPDLVTWTVRKTTSLEPTAEADTRGVFTGCLSPLSAKAGTLTAFYTSATRSPIHYALPYIHGQELLHAATSSDSGKTWVRYENNPVLAGPPPDLDVTGWRDPFVAPWMSMARVLDEPPATLYALIAGGTKDSGPTSFLYSLSPESLYDWSFVSTLGTMPKTSSASGDRYDFGSNWEVTNFISFPDPDSTAAKDSQLDFLVMSVEGMTEGSERSEHTEFRRDHKQMWLCGQPQPGQDQCVEMAYRYGGFLDHGCFYAGNSFCDPKTQSHTIFGWLVEEDLSLQKRQAQGWSGMLSLPRTLKLQRLERVVGSLVSKIEGLKSFGVQKTGSQTYNLTTLCAVPDERLQKLRRNHRSLPPRILTPENAGGLEELPHGNSWELNASFRITSEIGTLGLILQHSKDDPAIRTIITFQRSTETLTITRRHSTTAHGDINTAEETAPHTIFTFLDDDSQLRREPLTLRVFFDVSVLEVFANERTAISTRVYPDSGTCYRVVPFVQGGDCEMLHFDYWEMASNVRTED